MLAKENRNPVPSLDSTGSPVPLQSQELAPHTDGTQMLPAATFAEERFTSAAEQVFAAGSAHPPT